MNLIELILMAMIDIIGYIILSRKIIERDRLNKYKLIITIVFFSVVMGSMKWYSLSDMRVMIVSLLLIFATIYYLYGEDILNSSYIFLITTASILLVQFSVISIFEI